MKSKLILLLCLGMFLISLTSATISVTLPVEAPENLTATLQGGGSLDADTTYYYVVIAYDDTYFSPASYTRFNYHSPLSEEENFTTNETHKSAYIEWDAGAGDVNYQVLLTKTSGDYTNSGGFGTALENIGTITSTNYNVTEENNGAYAIHSANLVNNLSYGINKDLGIIKVYINGESLVSTAYPNPALNTIYNAIVDAGYGDYAYWDRYHFAIKGWIVIDGIGDVAITIRNADITFIKGGLHINNPNAVVTFGYWTDDYVGADYSYGCKINLQNSRYPFRSLQEGTLYVYGSRIIASNREGLLAFESEILSSSYYIGGANLYLAYKIDGIKDNILGMGIRSVTSEVYDLKIGIGNNWHSTDSHRLEITRNKNFCYSTGCKIYDTTWRGDTAVSGQKLVFYVPAACIAYSTYLYNPIFTVQYDSNNNIPLTFYFQTNYGCLVSDTYLQVHNSIIAKVINSTGQPIEDVKVYLTDKDGNAGTWIEHEDNVNRKVTGDEYALNVSTNENGTIDYYTISYNVTLNQSNDIADAYCDNYNFTAFYPYALTFEKDGYENYTIYLDTLTKETNLLVALEETEIPSPASLVLDKIISLNQIENETISYNITLRLTNKGGSNATSVNITDSDSESSPYDIGTLSNGNSTSVSYLENFTRNSTNYPTSLSLAQAIGNDSITLNETSSNSSEISIIIPSSSTDQQLTLIKNAYYNSENSTHVNYTLSIEIVNSGGRDLSTINLIDTDLNLNQIISLNRTQNYFHSNHTIIEKAASNTNKLFVKSSANANTIVYESNQIQVRIPGYGGPADAIVYTPSSVYTSSDFDTTITVRNMNSDIGQDFTVDYWITNEDESVNYSSGQQTIYVGILGESNLTATLNSPSSAGNYKFKAMVSWTGGTAHSYESFSATSPPQETPSGAGSSGSVFTTSAVQEIVCNYPYMRYGIECCLNSNNNSICDKDEFQVQENQTIPEETEQIPQEEIPKEKPKLGFIKEGFTNIKQLFSKKQAQKQDYNKTNAIILLLIIILIIIILIFSGIFLIRRLKKKKYQSPETPKKIEKLKEISVYNKNKEEMGKIKGAYLDTKSGKISGWLIELDDKVMKKLGLEEKEFFIKQGEYDLN